MAIVTFWNALDKEYGCTAGAIALATRVAIERNIKVILISTAFDDSTIEDGFWQYKKKSSFGIFQNNKSIENSGIEELDRAIRSNKLSPSSITNYTKIILKGRFEVMLGVKEKISQYELVQEKYPQIISLANEYYDLVIVDLDKKIEKQTEIDILKQSDIIIPVISQNVKEIKKIQKKIRELDVFNEYNTVLAIGKYMHNTKYNAKNLTRTILKQKDIVNTIPYNNLFFEALQEGMIVDLFLNLMRTKDRDDNAFFIDEIKRLYEYIKVKLEILDLKL